LGYESLSILFIVYEALIANENHSYLM
jgi:hypothetical protein